MKRLNQSGSHIIAVAVGILVLGVVAFAGYTVMQRQDKTSTTTSTTTSSTAGEDVNLDDEATTLDDSSSQVDNGLNDSELDSDLNDML